MKYSLLFPPEPLRNDPIGLAHIFFSNGWQQIHQLLVENGKPKDRHPVVFFVRFTRQKKRSLEALWSFCRTPAVALVGKFDDRSSVKAGCFLECLARWNREGLKHVSNIYELLLLFMRCIF